MIGYYAIYYMFSCDERSDILSRKVINEILINVLIIIFSIIFATGIMGAYYYFKIPKQAIMTVPGKMFPATELIEYLDDTSLHGLSVNRFIIEERNEFLKYMWHTKKLHLNYSYIPYTTSDELLETRKTSVKQSIESEITAANSLEAYTINHYASDASQAEEVLAPLTWYMDYLGDSSTLLIMVSLIGMYENKPWLNSDSKIAMTASMDADGNVLPVGSVRLKTITAKSQKADVLFVPKEQLDDTKRLIHHFWRPMEIIGVETIDEVIEWLDENI